MDPFTDVPPTPDVLYLLDGMLEVRRDLLLDPLVATPWSCDPDRCRPRLGQNLCCKVQVRCRHMQGERCGIHDSKPLVCRLFPLDLIRVAGARVVTTVLNLDFFHTGWSRYDRDMLRCFEGAERARVSMFQAQRDVLADLLTRAELTLLERTLTNVLGAVGAGSIMGGLPSERHKSRRRRRPHLEEQEHEEG
ncbi:MAG: hypothetical protein HZB55_13720 [Deltaproteobacteria bacterium]|nr:hypothetical protein [Deltaproteobacteria bacterium]